MTSTLDRVTQLVVQVAGLGPETHIDANTALVGGGLALDSVAVLEVLIALEYQFNVEITAEELVKGRALQSVGRLVSFIEAKTGSAGEAQ